MLSMNLIVLSTKDLECSIKFYTLIGLKLIKEKHGDGPIHYSCDMDGLVLEIYPATPKFPTESSTRIGICVENISLLKENLEKNKIPFKLIKDLMIVEDPDGRKLYISKKDNKN